MSATRALWQFSTTTVIVVGILVALGAWYLLVAITSAIVILAVFLYKSLNAKRASSEISPVEAGVVTPEQSKTIENGGRLQSTSPISLRVVNSSDFAPNHNWLASRLQIEGEEDVEIEGFILASQKLLERDGALVEQEVLYVGHDDRVLGELPEIDLTTWYDEVLEYGGALRCLLTIHFDSALRVQRIRASGYSTS